VFVVVVWGVDGALFSSRLFLSGARAQNAISFLPFFPLNRAFAAFQSLFGSPSARFVGELIAHVFFPLPGKNSRLALKPSAFSASFFHPGRESFGVTSQFSPSSG